MPPGRDPTPVPWSSRTIQPPGSIALLRRAIAARPHGAMLESVAFDPTMGRYSIFAPEPVRLFTVPDAPQADPFIALARACRPRYRLEPTPDLPFVGGWIGFLAYEAGRFVEPAAFKPHAPQGNEPACPLATGRSTTAHRPGGTPISHWALFDTVLIHDALAGRWTAAGVCLPPGLADTARPPIGPRLDAIERFVADLGPDHSAVGDPPSTRTGRPKPDRGQWNLSRDAYLAKVERTLEYIRAGDIFQANIARRYRVDVNAPPIELYERLCQTNPAAYAAYLQIPGFEDLGSGPRPQRIRNPQSAIAVLSSSPELFLNLRANTVTTRPIKGTRPRGKTPARDADARQALAGSQKDRAELNMIIDLLRNDLGRVCEYGTIRVVHDGEIETLPTVFHRTATVTGRLRDDADALDLLRAAFPGGSVTGAPKVRAMQIINELEPHPRGPYCGAIGAIGLDGSIQLNLAIRTMTVTQGRSRIQAFKDSRGRGGTGPLESSNPRPLESSVFLHVGSGIVADSDPEDEYLELQAKAAGMLAALHHCPAAQQTDGPHITSRSPRPSEPACPQAGCSIDPACLKPVSPPEGSLEWSRK